MFSLEKFYFILYANLLKPASIYDCYFYPFGSTDVTQLMFGMHDHLYTPDYTELHKDQHYCFYYDQEPFDIKVANKCTGQYITGYVPVTNNAKSNTFSRIVAVGEISNDINTWCKETNYKNWYYFFHGFAALDWYRDYQYTPQIENQFTRVFISYNRLVTKSRSYRLYFVSQLMKHNLLEHGYVSLILKDNGLGSWQQELADPDTLLSEPAKLLIQDQIGTLENSLTIDKDNPPGTASADSGYAELMMHKSALWHVVTETVFYYDKLHLTEKIFKPITAKRPFMLLGAVHNLAYLKSYGFKTFDQWIDESYDDELDPDRRIELVVAELEKLCKLKDTELAEMYKEMQDILEFNFNHFYSKFKNIIVDELVTNFKDIVLEWNSSDPVYPIDTNQIDFDQVQRLLSQ